MTEQKIINELLGRIDWVENHNRTLEEEGGIVNTIQTYLADKLDKKMIDEMCLNVMKGTKNKRNKLGK